ncbi:MAG: hypothetical protein EOO05_11880 [Chitinophagaceae bacterium]|nr:MAG: hypothetical protein EOO05_11880 [Chitinophagaceae bacterium]
MFTVKNTKLETAAEIGSKALLNNNRGTGNTAIGFEAGYGLEDGGFSVALGHLALHTMTSGFNNVAIGQKAMEMATGGDYNISIGSFAMQYNSGNSNTAVGQQAMYDNKSGSNNTAIGENALTNNTSGIGNTALGSGALTNNFTGTNNMGLGYHANVNSTDLTAASAIGAYSVVGCSNCITLGQTQISGNPASTKVGLGMINPLAKLHIKQSFDGYPVDGAGLRIERNGNANHWELGTDFADDFDFAFNGVIKAFIRDTDGQYVVVSDRRSKRDITDVPSVLPLLLNLKAKKYHYNDNKSGDPLSWGFIAQDVEQLFPEFVTTKGPDNLKAVAYQNFSVVAVKAIQEQQAVIEELKNDVNTLKNELNQLKEQFRTLTANK